MKLEVGKMDKLDIKPGDVIECIDDFGCFTPGSKYQIRDDGKVCDDDGNLWPLKHTGHHPVSTFKIVTDAPKPVGPVRMVQVKKIVDGVYAGGVIVTCDDLISVTQTNDAATIRAAIATLSEIADAMEENSK